MEELQAQIDAKMVKATPHPTERLSILNYTQVATFNPESWNHVTDKCRGLIYNPDTLEIVARGFEKFWNINDSRHPETMMENLPTSKGQITRKMDGSLGIAYEVNGKVSIATRGSFTSDQAVWATEWLNKQCAYYWPGRWTPVFEIIYPENQIVVRYDFSGLMLLALIDNETGEEADRKFLEWFAFNNGFKVVAEFDKPLDELVAEDTQNEEGYVVSWPRPGTTPLRVKIKMATYCRLHKLLTQTNAVTVWEMLKDGQDVATLTQDVLTEFKQWIDGIEAGLLVKFREIETQAWIEFNKLAESWHLRKEFALQATQKQPVTAILFAMYDGKDYGPIIWKMLKPRGDEARFKTDD